eukprot:26697-Hanusia_phi.AAC.1
MEWKQEISCIANCSCRRSSPLFTMNATRSHVPRPPCRDFPRILRLFSRQLSPYVSSSSDLCPQEEEASDGSPGPVGHQLSASTISDMILSPPPRPPSFFSLVSSPPRPPDAAASSRLGVQLLRVQVLVEEEEVFLQQQRLTVCHGDVDLSDAVEGRALVCAALQSTRPPPTPPHLKTLASSARIERIQKTEKRLWKSGRAAWSSRRRRAGVTSRSLWPSSRRTRRNLEDLSSSARRSRDEGATDQEQWSLPYSLVNPSTLSSCSSIPPSPPSLSVPVLLQQRQQPARARGVTG